MCGAVPLSGNRAAWGSWPKQVGPLAVIRFMEGFKKACQKRTNRSMRQIALLLFVVILIATPSFAQSSLNVYETFEGGSSGQALSTSILNTGLVCNGAGGTWSLQGNASTQMQVTTAAEQPLLGAITACGKVFNPPDGTLGAIYNLNTTSSGYARFSWSGNSKNASSMELTI